MNRQLLVAIPMAVILIVLGGCAIGYDTIMFVSKTNAGFEADTQPPALQVSLDRLEVVFAPSYEGGQTPPVLASFQAKGTGGLLSSGFGSAFAAGDAAVAMSVLYNAADHNSVAGTEQQIGLNVSTFTKANWKDIDGPDGPFNSGLELSKKPKFPDWLPAVIKDRDYWEVRPLMFGTDTMLGAKVAWSGLTAQIPDTLRLAFARKELALSPVTLQPKEEDGADDEPFIARAPSLLGTTDALLDTGGFLDTSFNYIQYFATGRAATALALRYAVRQSMIKRFDPEQLLAQRKAKRIKQAQERQAKDDGTAEINARKATINGWLGDTTTVDLAKLGADATNAGTKATNAQAAADRAIVRRDATVAGTDDRRDTEAEVARARTAVAKAQTAADAAQTRLADAKRVAAALGPPTPSTVKQGDINRYRLLKRLKANGYKVSVDEWLKGASLQELDLAIKHLDIP